MPFLSLIAPFLPQYTTLPSVKEKLKNGVISEETSVLRLNNTVHAMALKVSNSQTLTGRRLQRTTRNNPTMNRDRRGKQN